MTAPGAAAGARSGRRAHPVVAFLPLAVLALAAGCSGGGSASLVTVETFAGSGEPGYTDGAPSEARFTSPEGLAVAPDGTLFVVETLRGRIRRVDPSGHVSTVVDGDDVGLRGPHRIAVHPDGTLIVTDAGNHRVVRLTVDGELTIVAGTGESGFADGPGKTARFRFPIGVTVSADGTIYVADSGNRRVRRIAPNGIVTTIAGTGEPGFRDGDAAQAQFDGLNEIAVDAGGTVFVSELGPGRIRAITPAGQVSTVLGRAGRGSNDGPIASAQLAGPSGLAFTARGTLLVADTFGHRLREVVLGEAVSTLAGDGTAGRRDGAGDRARFDRPTAIVVASNGVIFVADTGNHTIRRVIPNAAP